jgi:putative alpha-1,2-mannosidase
VIEVKNNQPENYFIQSATLNGKPLTNQWLPHDQITGGGKLVLEMGKYPNIKWGSIK